MSDDLIRSYTLRRERPFIPPGEFILSRVVVGCVLLATVVATLSIAAAATREPASEGAKATATTGTCAGLPGHDADAKAEKRYLVIATGEPVQLGEAVQVETR